MILKSCGRRLNVAAGFSLRRFDLSACLQTESLKGDDNLKGFGPRFHEGKLRTRRNIKMAQAKACGYILVAVLAVVNLTSAESVAPLKDQQAIPAGQPDEILYIQEGTASWYGKDFHGKSTSNGEEYDMHDKTCAHKTLPLNTYVRITNLLNGSSTLVRVNDRGPFVKDRIVDMSYAVAKELDMVRMGTGRVRLEAMGIPQGEKWDNSTLAEAITHGNFTVQVGSFKDKDKAQHLVKKLASDFEGVRMVVMDSNQGRFYRVRVGRYESLEDAEKVCQVLGDKGYRQSFAMAE